MERLFPFYATGKGPHPFASIWLAAAYNGVLLGVYTFIVTEVVRHV